VKAEPRNRATTTTQAAKTTTALRVPGALGAAAQTYARCMDKAPLATKAATSAAIFGASDACAQKLERVKEPDATRLLTTTAIGGLYFAPAVLRSAWENASMASGWRRRAAIEATQALKTHKKTTQAHVWYAQITKLIPKNGLKEILTKALLGQIFFGPLVTIVFFAAACAQGEGLSTLPAKIKADLLQVQIAGAGFWPFVDLISYAFIPIAYIPLFVNCASFVWTIFLSLKSRVGKK
jgi:protein Mpv17